MTPVHRPVPIRTDNSNWFANDTMKRRVPGIIAETLALNPDYPAPIRDGLLRLSESIIANALIPLLSLPAPDYDDWKPLHTFYTTQHGESWLNTAWFFAEFYMYRLMIQITRWWETGRDPFFPKKVEELAGSLLWEMLDQVLAVDSSAENRLAALIHSATWGNRVDLSYNIADTHGRTGNSDDLLVDHTEQAITLLLGTPGDVHIIADNAGTELALDLALADALLALRPSSRVVLHLKGHPLFVSDTIVADVGHFLGSLTGPGQRSAALRRMGQRLQDALESGQLRLAPDLYWCQSQFLRDMPPRLVNTFAGAALIILKGDANYRRAVDDALWPETMPFSEVMSYFPAPLLALRTLKSDPILGLPGGLAARLDEIDSRWRNNGRRAVIQISK